MANDVLIMGKIDHVGGEMCNTTDFYCVLFFMLVNYNVDEFFCT